jgi:hypothetical protein
MFSVAFVIFTDLVALTFSFPAKATLKYNNSRIAKTVIIPTFAELFIASPDVFYDSTTKI